MRILIAAIVIVSSILLSACTDKAVTSSSESSHDITNITPTKTNNTYLQAPKSTTSLESQKKEQGKLQIESTPKPLKKHKTPTAEEPKNSKKQKEKKSTKEIRKRKQ